MGVSCCRARNTDPQRRDVRYERVLWIVLGINATMFFVEMFAGLASRSASLQADALDFLGDTANYGVSLFVAGLTLRNRARAALVKGLTMGCFGLWIFGSTLWNAAHSALPRALTMGGVGAAALIANAIVFALLWTYRSGDSNRQSVWLCSRNDVIGNGAVLLAAAGVLGTGKGWPDLMVAFIMSVLALQGAWAITRTASHELAGAQA